MSHKHHHHGDGHDHDHDHDHHHDHGHTHKIPEAYGTPLMKKTPINFARRKQALETANNEAMKKLLIACFVSGFFIVIQLIGGYMAKSIAIFTDSAHLASDILGFFISMMSLKCAAKPANKELSYGWHRSEIVGTLVSIIFIWGLTLWLVYEATLRVLYPQPVLGGIMLVVSILGLVFNIIQMKILGHDHGHGHGHDHGHGHNHGHGHSVSHHEANEPLQIKDPEAENRDDLREQLLPKGPGSAKPVVPPTPHQNINITSAYLHVLGDLLMSVGVIIAAIIINWQPTWTIADPICTYVFSVVIMFTSIPTFKDCMMVLMEATPDNIDVDKLEQDIVDSPDVEELHDLHIWSISQGKFSMSCHIISKHPLKTLHYVTDMCRRKYKLYHTTIQVESRGDNPHQFECENDLHE